MVTINVEREDKPNDFNLKSFIDHIDPVVWDTVCHITRSSKSNEQSSLTYTKKRLRRAYLVAQIMFSIDSRCTTPFHTQITDLVDCCGGSNELIRILNRLGVCSSYDTLLRHIQACTAELSGKGILHLCNPPPIQILDEPTQPLAFRTPHG